MTNVSRVGPFNASSVWVLPVSDPTYVAYRGSPTRSTLWCCTAHPRTWARRTAGNGRSGSSWSARRLDGGSQLLLRHRYAYGPDWTSRLVFGRFPLEVVSLVMSRKMMLNINRLTDRET